jgi:putative SOS response-associated peptidase YedK
MSAGEVEDFVDLLAIANEPPPPSRDTRPTDPVFVILQNPKKGENEFREMRWGLVPHWAKDLKIRTKLINARAESLAEQPAFREAYKARRCILPLAWFYEFDDTTRYRIGMASQQSFGVAGLWEARRWEDQPLLTCTMVTTTPNELVSRVHDRMPAILRREDWAPWVDPAFYDPDALAAMLTPISGDEMSLEVDGPRASRKRK